MNVLVYEIQRGLNIAQIEQIELYRLPQKITTACFILRNNLRAGHEAGAEAAIHAMHQIWDEENTEGILLIDARNAFNSLNRKVALPNILIDQQLPQ